MLFVLVHYEQLKPGNRVGVWQWYRWDETQIPGPTLTLCVSGLGRVSGICVVNEVRGQAEHRSTHRSTLPSHACPPTMRLLPVLVTLLPPLQAEQPGESKEGLGARFALPPTCATCPL